MEKSSYYKYAVVSVNTKTGEESLVCKVRAAGDLNNILHGLEKAVRSSPIIYKSKKL